MRLFIRKLLEVDLPKVNTDTCLFCGKKARIGFIQKIVQKENGVRLAVVKKFCSERCLDLLSTEAFLHCAYLGEVDYENGKTYIGYLNKGSSQYSCKIEDITDMHAWQFSEPVTR